jgi:polyferredoxin
MVLAWWLLAATVVWADEEGGRRPMGVVDILLLPKVWVGAIFCVVGLTLLARAWVGRKFRIAWLAVAFVMFGVVGALPLGNFARGMGLHPSPVCAITRPFQFIEAGRSIPLIFFTLVGVISTFSVVGNKLFCGWVCPLGAIQEIPQRIKLSKRLREKIRITLPFRVTNAIRVVIFAVFVAVVFTAGASVYDYFNPFEFFHWKFGVTAVIAMTVTLVAAVFVFRPFCYIACPIGLLTWLIEHVSFARIRVDKDECNMCEACIKLTNCPAVGPTLEGRRSRPDCHACGQCVAACPQDALRFK